MKDKIKGHEYLKYLPERYQNTNSNSPRMRTTSVEKKEYGYLIKRFSNFVSTQRIRLEVYSDGFAKAIVKVNTNYQLPYQCTTYFDSNMKEIKDNSTRKELSIWKSLRKSKTNR